MIEQWIYTDSCIIRMKVDHCDDTVNHCDGAMDHCNGIMDPYGRRVNHCVGKGNHFEGTVKKLQRDSR